MLHLDVLRVALSPGLSSKDFLTLMDLAEEALSVYMSESGATAEGRELDRELEDCIEKVNSEGVAVELPPERLKEVIKGFRCSVG